MHFHRKILASSTGVSCMNQSAIVTSQWSIVMSQSSSNCDVTISASERGTDFGCLDQYYHQKYMSLAKKRTAQKIGIRRVYVCYEECPILTCEYSVQLFSMCSYLSTHPQNILCRLYYHDILPLDGVMRLRGAATC